jgi:hydroxyacylglutathione hydrolase
MFFTQVVHSDLGCASYVVASTVTGEAMVVDPRWEIEPYLEIGAEHGFRIAKIVETHNHADHVSGHGRLAKETGAEILIHESADVEYPHHPLADGETIDMGDVRAHVIHTPGHRPEHIALAIEDVSRGADPWIVLTGDSLFIGDVARPDLAVDGAEGAGLLFESLHQKLMRLPEFAAVYPAHVAGSLCGRVTSEVFSSTLGYEKRYNVALEMTDRSEFIKHMNENLPQRPPNMTLIVATNRGPLVCESVPPRRLNPDEAEKAIGSGGIALDVRPTSAYLEAHVPASIHVPVSGSQFGTRVGFVVPIGAPIVLIAGNAGEAEFAATSLRVVAYDNITGFLEFPEWRAAGKPVKSIRSISVGELNQRLGRDARAVDVREGSEWAEGTVPGAITTPYRELADRLPEVPDGELVAVMCASGGRSAIGASILERAGISNLASVEGGMTAWKAAGLPIHDGT